MAEAIVVKTQRIVVYPPRGKIDIFGFGPTGPPGPPGPPGSGATIAWPIVAPANSTGNITFTPSTAGNDIRGLQTPDAASWMRFWSVPPCAVWLRANSGPSTGGLNGQIYLDADRVDIRESSAASIFATFSKTGHTINLATVFSGAVTVNGATSFASSLTVAGLLTANGGITSASILQFPNSIEAIRMAAAGSYQTWYNGGTRIGYFQGNSNQIYLNGEAAGVSVRIRGSGGVQLDNGAANYSLSENSGTYRVVASTGNGYILTNYFNMTANTQGACDWVAGMSGNDNYLRWCNAVSLAGQISGLKQNNNATYYDQNFYSNTQGVGAAAGYGMHPGGVAGSIRMGINSGQWHFNNVDGSGYYPLAASGYNVASHPRFKSSVVSARIPRPIDVMRELRPVWYQVPGDILEPMEVWEFVDGMDMNDGNGPAKEVRRKEVRFVNHDCDTSPYCEGTSADPCQRVVGYQRGRIGLMADEIERIFPVISTYGMKGELLGYDLAGLVTLLVAAVQNLSDEVNQLRMEAA